MPTDPRRVARIALLALAPIHVVGWFATDLFPEWLAIVMALTLVALMLYGLGFDRS